MVDISTFDIGPASRAIFTFLRLAVAPHAERATTPSAVTILAGGLGGLFAVAFHVSIIGLEALLIDRANVASGHNWMLGGAVGYWT